MAYQPNPNDPHRAGRSEEEMRRRDNELQADPQLADGPASGTKIAADPAGQPCGPFGQDQHRARHDHGRGDDQPSDAAVSEPHRYGSRSQQTVKVDLPTRWDLWHAREKLADQLDKIEKKVA